VARSEENAIIGKVSYTDLNLTHYPDKIDSSIISDPGYNVNMKGFENIKDYNMAEHINAVSDGIMSIERTLGTTPFVDKDGVDRGTVGARITILENKDYDPRYGGSGWILSQTLIGHTHTGQSGHPSQINLVMETQGELPKNKINLTFGHASALTGAEIPVSNSDSRKIADAINDKLSITQGGVIQKSLEVKGGFLSRFYREWDATTITGGTLTTDYSAMTNQVRRVASLTETSLLSANIANLLYGKYVIAFRLKVSVLPSVEVFRTGFYNLLSNGTWVLQSGLSIKGTDFTAIDQWQMFYQIVEHKGERADATGLLNVIKSATTVGLNLDIDNIMIMPTHPAIYDR
jgi:hypothetical protein